MVFIKHGSVFSSSRPDCAPRYWFQQRINKISDGTGGHHRMCFGLFGFFLAFITGSISFLPFEAERRGWRCSTLLRRGGGTEHPSGCCSSLFRRQNFADVPSDEKRQTGGGELPCEEGDNTFGAFTTQPRVNTPRVRTTRNNRLKDAALCRTTCFIRMSRSFL